MAIVFVLHNRNQVRLTAKSIIGLRERGHTVHVVDLEQIGMWMGVREECIRLLGAPSHPLTSLDMLLSRDDLAIVGCDCAPPDFSNFVAHMRARGAILIGLVDGCRWAQSQRYRVVDYVLSYAPATRNVFARRAISRPVTIVGSPVIEASIAEAKPAPRLRSFALLNHKYPAGPSREGADQSWLRETMEACAAAKVCPVVSQHPLTPKPQGIAVATEDFSELIGGAAVLVSPPSTTIIEALVLGVPVVLYPKGEEPIFEFSEPHGAFEIIRDPENLSQAISTAISTRSSLRTRARHFLEEQLSIEPSHPAWQRIIGALEDVLHHIKSGSAERAAWGRLDFFPVRLFQNHTGSQQHDAIFCVPNKHPQGHCLFGLDYFVRTDARYRATFEVLVEPAINADQPVVTLDVYENLERQTVIADRRFNGAIGKSEFQLEFDAITGYRLEFRVFWHGQVRIEVKGVYLEELGPRMV